MVPSLEPHTTFLPLFITATEHHMYQYLEGASIVPGRQEVLVHHQQRVDGSTVRLLDARRQLARLHVHDVHTPVLRHAEQLLPVAGEGDLPAGLEVVPRGPQLLVVPLRAGVGIEVDVPVQVSAGQEVSPGVKRQRVADGLQSEVLRRLPDPGFGLFVCVVGSVVCADLVAECRRNGWKARCEPIEVGCRGFAGKSLHWVLGLLGICGQHKRRAIKNILEASEKASRWLWLKRGEAWRSALPGHNLKELKQRGEERREGHSQEEKEEKVGGEGGGGERWRKKRWRVQQLERDKLEMITAHNHEVSGLQAVLTGLRAELERGEVERQSLEYQLALSQRQTDRETDRSTTLTTHNHTLREHVLQLEQRLSEVEVSLCAREQDQHALRQEVSEAERLVQKAEAQNHRLTQETQQLHTLLEDKEEALQEVKREKEKENDDLRELTGKLHLLQGRQEESRRQEEQWVLRIKCLESNMEAERAAHIEAKVRVQALEGAAAVARCGQQEALSDLQLLRSQFREVERAITTTHTVDTLEKQYQQFKSDLSVALETERKATSNLFDRLEEEKREHAHTQSLLEQSSKRQVYLEELYVSCTTQIRKTLDQHNTGRCVVAKPEVNDNSSTEVLEILTETLNSYHQNLDTATQQVQDLLCASEKLRTIISDQRQHTQELETILSSQQQEMMHLRQESSDWSKRSQDLKGQLEQSRLALEREREERKMEGEREREERKMEGEREREERKAEVQKITNLYHKETKKSLSFLYALYHQLLVGCKPSQSIMGNFTWAELCDVITQQADRLTLDLRNANDKLSVCVCELQRSQECVSRLEDATRQREELCVSLQQQCSSLTSDLWNVREDLEGERRAGAGLLAACALLAGVVQEFQRRCISLRHQKEVLLLRGRWGEEVGEEAGRLASALGGEEEEEEMRGRGLRRWRVCTCALLALHRMCARAATVRVCVRLERATETLCVRLPPHLATPTPDRDQEEEEDDGGGGDEEPGSMCVNWLRSKRLSILLHSSMSQLQELLSHTGNTHTITDSVHHLVDRMVDKATLLSPSLGPSNQELESAAHSGLSRLLEALLHQSHEISHVTAVDGCKADTKELSLASRLGRGLARLQASPQRSSRGVVERLQQHFLVFSQRLHSAEVERRALRLEVANQKQTAKGHQNSAHLVPPDRFNSVCEELRAALSREEQLQTLLKKQHAQNHTHNQCRQEVRRKDQALRILGKHLSGMQREKRELEDSLHLSRRRRDVLIHLLKTSENTFTQVRDTLVQWRCSVQPLPPDVTRGHMDLSRAESVLGGPDITACQAMLCSVSELVQAAFSRIGWLEQEVSAQQGHVTALRSELQDVCLRDNLAYVPVRSPSDTITIGLVS
ncbi:Coiled-coil domain-containing protein 171 [Merluccius polli]|uniref:Coiled-coil domain-containing protein 171 n=1 Tax=Merluccius polli TaxID=89951 RepID=A0AA47NCS6_MERPO|nr:Coiled-coil domain-containing protein 171 [Merluccius polli]